MIKNRIKVQKQFALMIISGILTCLIFSCVSNDDPKAIIERAIQEHGGEKYKNVAIEFEFRNRLYNVIMRGGEFSFKRNYKDSSGIQISETMDNDTTLKIADDKEIKMSKKERNRIRASINSVIYFVLLPYRLNDEAVIKRYLGETEVSGKRYHKIEVTFKETGGGEDFEDRYVYWFNKDTFTMDYLAYYFYVNGGGSRFRRIHNVRRVGGILFSDHENFTSDEIDKNVEDYDLIFEKGILEKISDVNISSIKVEHL